MDEAVVDTTCRRSWPPYDGFQCELRYMMAVRTRGI
jgi:hypothetical protein